MPQFIYLYKGQICQAKRCSRFKCTDDAWCNRKGGKDQYNCVKGKCILKTVCKRDGDCPSNSYCEKNECIQIKQCNNKQQCKIKGAVCKSGKCQKECQTNVDCMQAKSECRNGFCIWRKKNNACYLDKHCKSGLCHHSGECMEECKDKVECPSKYTCLDNLCVPCDASNKDICQSSCSSDKDCNQNESCLEGHCIQTCSKQKCPESQICVRNHCYDDCKYGESCPKGFYCVFGACLPEMPCSNKCRKGYWCLRLSKSKPTYVNSGNNAPTSGKNNNFQRQKLSQIWNSSARGRNRKD